jgi:hypothetical protein
MVYGFTSSDCLLLVIASAIMSGAVPTWRKYLAGNVPTGVFSVIFTVSRFLTALILWAALSRATIATSSESASNFFLIFGSGLIALIGNYFWFSCGKSLAATTNAACSSSTYLVIGTFVDYIISKTNTNLTFLIVGTLLSLLGLLSLSGAGRHSRRCYHRSLSGQPFVSIWSLCVFATMPIFVCLPRDIGLSGHEDYFFHGIH